MINLKKNKLLIIGLILVVILAIITFILNRSSTSTVPIATIPLQPEATTSGVVQDTTADYQYGQTLIQIHKDYPWYSQIPIETKDYRIIYDFDKNSFRIRLLTTSSEQIKQEALESLKKIGVDLNQFTYYFLEP